MKRKALIISLLFLTFSCSKQDETPQVKAQTNPEHIFILSGQSNMELLDVEKYFTPIVSQELPNVKVHKFARSGKSITNWYNNGATGTYYHKMMDSVAISNNTASVTFIWMQGERDARDETGHLYEENLKGLIDQVKQDTGSDLKVVIGHLSDYEDPNYPDWNQIKSIQKKITNSNSNYRLAHTADLNGAINDLHYTENGYRLFGKRLANNALLLIL